MKKLTYLLILIPLFSFSQNSSVSLQIVFDTVICEPTPKAYFTFQIQADTANIGPTIEIADMNFRLWYDSEKMLFDTLSIVGGDYQDPIESRNDVNLNASPSSVFGFDDDMGFLDYVISIESTSGALSIQSEWTDFMTLSFDLLDDYQGDCLQVLFSKPTYGGQANYMNSFCIITEVIDGSAAIQGVNINNYNHWNWQADDKLPAGDCATVACDPSSNKDISLFNDIVVYPNPTTDILKIEALEDFEASNIQLSVLNQLGQSIWKEIFQFMEVDLMKKFP